jgi:tetratricopeptide (TPR) repeat protein
MSAGTAMEQTVFRYDAFISYSHSKDRALAIALQGVVQTLGKPWYRRRALRVFRDESSLSANPALWPSIEQALAESSHLILLACPEAADSKWVCREVEWWRANRDPKAILLALTDGDLIWDAAARDFEDSPRSALPAPLKGAFADEPNWVDFRGSRDLPPRVKADRAFVAAAAGLVSAIRAVPKDDLISEELRQQRRALVLASGAAAILAVLAVAASWAAIEAVRAQRVAQVQQHEAEAQKRAAEEQRRVAEEQSGRATRSLSLATQTAANLIQDITDNYPANSTGPSTPIVSDILDRIQVLEDQLRATVSSNQYTERLRAANLGERAGRARGKDNKKAQSLAVQATDIFTGLLVNDPHNYDVQHQLVASYSLIGAIELDQGDMRALTDFQRANATALIEVSDHSSTKDARRDLYNSYNNIALVQKNMKQYDAAIISYNDAIKEIQDAIRVAPLDRDLNFDLSSTYKFLGDIYLKQQNTVKATQYYDDSIRLLRELNERLPEDTAVADRLGAFLVVDGEVKRRAKDMGGAQVAFNSAAAVLGKLTEENPSNVTWIRDAIWSYRDLASLAYSQDRIDISLQYYQSAEDGAKRLTALEPGNIDNRQQLSVITTMVGDVQKRTGNFDQALQSYRSGLSLDLLHSGGEPVEQWMYDLLIDYERIGDLLFFQLGDAGAALAPFEEARSLAERYAARKPKHPDTRHEQWEREQKLSDVSVKVGDVQMKTGDLDQALQTYRSALGADQRRSLTEPLEQWVYYLLTDYKRIGDLLFKRGDASAALAPFQEALSLADRYGTRKPDEPEAQRHLEISYFKVAKTYRKLGQIQEARAALDAGHAVAEKLVAEHPDYPIAKSDLDSFKTAIADINK